MPLVGSKCEQTKQHAEHVLALRRPSHGLNVYRMKRKECCRDETSSRTPGGPLQHQKEQDNVQPMQQDVDVVVADGIQTEQLAVQGMRKPSQRMPVSLFGGGECP